METVIAVQKPDYTYLAKRAEFFRFQNWKNNTAQEIRHMKKIGRTKSCIDLGLTKSKRKHPSIRVIKSTKFDIDVHVWCTIFDSTCGCKATF